MNSPAKTHFTISPEEWMNLSKVALWHDYGDPGLLHNIIDEYADALISQRVAVVRPTRDEIAAAIGSVANARKTQLYVHECFDAADAVLAEFGVAVSDSQETPEEGREE